MQGTTRFDWREWLGVALLSVGAALVWGHEIVNHFGEWALANDWDQHLAWYEAVRRTLVDYHQLPLWNPWACGGTPLLGNSQSRVFTPFLLLQFVFGLLPGLHLDFLMHLALMCAGGWFLGRSVGLGGWGSAVVALVFPGSSWLGLHLTEGHSWALSYAWMPWIFGCTVRALQGDARWSLGAGALLGFCLHDDGIYPGPQAALCVAFLCIWQVAARRSLRPLGIGVLVALVAFGIAAPKLGPVWELMKRNPRHVDSAESTGWKMLKAALFDTDQDRYRQRFDDRWYWGFHEYGAYLGPLVMALITVGLLPSLRRRAGWVIGMLLLLGLGLGDFASAASDSQPALAPYSFWGQLHKLPLFSSQHVPSRFLTVFVLFAAVVGGAGADWLANRFGERGRMVALGLLVGAFVDQAHVGSGNLRHMFLGPKPELGIEAPFAQVWASSDRVMFPTIKAGLGAAHCYEYAALGSKVRTEPGTPNFWIDGQGKVSPLAWSPNRLEFEVDLPGPAKLVINQNRDIPWRLAEGQGRVLEEDGLLTAELPAGKQRVVLAYVSTPFRQGMAVLLLTLLLSGLWLWRGGPLKESSPAAS